MKVETLDQNEVHLWYQGLDSKISKDDFENQISLLSQEEKAKYLTLPLSPKKLEFLKTRVMIRSILARYLAVLPQDIEFLKNRHGRPTLKVAPKSTRLEFNLSHCQDFLVCAVGQDCELGVDVEKIKELSGLNDSLNNFCSPLEIQTFSKLTTHDQNVQFYKFWTLKEAYIKARGIGHSLPVKDISFSLENPNVISFSTSANLDLSPHNWRFKLINPTPFHQIALAVRQNQPAAIKFKARDWCLKSQTKV